MLELFLATLNQMAVLFALIIIGYLLVKFNCVSQDSAKTLSKLENMVFVPALILGTFMQNFTVETLSTAWKFLLMSLILAIAGMPIAFFFGKRFMQTESAKKLATYGLCFSNFGFMGNAVVNALFPEMFMEYVIFTIPFWTCAYVWGLPTLLIPKAEGEKKSFFSKIKPLINPMFICVILGALIGVLEIKMPAFVTSVVTSCGNCMSPLAMILTGVMVAKINLLELVKKWRLYLLSIVRLVLYPLLFILIFAFIPQNSFITPNFLLSGICLMAMPVGLTAVFAPAPYGVDTQPAAELALVSHVLSILTIPLIMLLFSAVFPGLIVF